MFWRTSESVVFFKQKTAYEISTRDWSSDVCSSDLCCRWTRRDRQRHGVTWTDGIHHLNRERRERRCFRYVGDNAGAGPFCHGGANPTDEHSPIATKVVPENLKKTASRESILRQTCDNTVSSDCSVKRKHHVRVNVGIQIVAVVPRFTGRIVAEVKGFAPRRAVTGAPPVPIVDDWLDREEVTAGRREYGREGRVNSATLVEGQVGGARREKVFSLQRSRLVVRSEFIETDIGSLEINRSPDETAGINSVDVCNQIELVGDLAVNPVRRPRLTWPIGGLVVGEL